MMINEKADFLIKVDDVLSNYIKLGFGDFSTENLICFLGYSVPILCFLSC